MAEDKEELLQMLNSYGQQFMSSFDASIFTSKRKGASEAGPSSSKKSKLEHNPALYEGDDEAEEWEGFGSSHSSGGEGSDSAEDEYDADNGKGPAVVVFSESKPSVLSLQTTSKAQLKAFMSSKVAKITQEPVSTSKKSRAEEEEEDDELTNAQNDALLHKLVHTKILSGSLDPDLEMTPAQRRKALAGRVLEAAGHAKLGKGETAVRAKERNKAAKHVRDGLIAKKKERTQKQLEEAKHLGNYHPALKQLFEDDTEQKYKPKRERGLKMGVGTFSGGVLKLSRQDIAIAAGPSQRGRERKGGKAKRI